jgi:hypothetical protein
MVSLPGDVAPERFHGFYDQVAPASELMRRQYEDIPPANFLERQSGLFAGIPKPRSKLRSIDGFMNSTTNYKTVQDAPHFMRMRHQHVAQRNLEHAAKELAAHHAAVHSRRAENESLLAARKHRAAGVKPYKSLAAGLKLKQALRQVLTKGEYRMQRETTKTVRKKASEKFSNDQTALLRKIAKVEEPVDETDLDALRRHDTEIQLDLAAARAQDPTTERDTVETLRRKASMRQMI